ncbi:MAG: hypothetical protein ACQEXJ_05865 [Myxococcota bacterium]
MDTTNPTLPRLGLLCAVVALGILAPTTARAGARVMVLLQERADGVAATSPTAEVRLSEQMTGAGVDVVERVETEAARQKLPLDKLLGGQVVGEVTALNADLLVVGRVDATREEIPYGVGDVEATSAEWTVRVLSVDGGRVVAAKSGRASASGTNRRAAFADASRKSADAMFEAIRGELKRGGPAGGTVGLAISGLQELAEVDRVKAALAEAPGVEEVTVRFVSGNETRIDLEVEGKGTYDIAAALKTLTGGALEVERLSASVVHARYNPHAKGRAVVVAAFLNATGSARHDWLRGTLPEVFETELSNSRYLSVSLPEVRPGVASARPDSDTVEDVLDEADADLLVTGKIAAAGGKYRLSLEVFRREGGSRVTAANVFAAEGELLDATETLVWEVDKKLYEKLYEKSGLGEYQPVILSRAPTGSKSTGSAGGERLLVESVTLDDLYPSRLPIYAEQPFGRVVLRNPSDRPMTGVRVRVQIPQVAAEPAVLRADDVPPGEAVEVPVTMVLDRAKVLAIRENTPARADLVVTYQNGEGEVTDAFTQSLVVFAKNAIDWSEAESVAAFVTHKDPAMEAFASQALRSGVEVPEHLAKPLRTPALLFEALATLPVQYQRDAANPFSRNTLDSVAFPGETLKRRAGDCDDLSVLYAALLESQGVGSAFLLTPGHILVAVDTGVSFERAPGLLGVKAALLMERDGRAWLPVEVTRLTDTFFPAVAAGAAEVNRHAGTDGGLEVIDVAEAWKSYPPFPGPFPDVADPSVDGEAVAARLADAPAGSGGAAMDLPDPDTLTDVATLTRHGVRLAERGRAEEALRYLERAAQLAPGRAEVAYNLANVRVIQSELDAAELAYRRLLDGRGYKARSHHGLGVVSYLRGDRKASLAAFRRSGLPDSRAAMKRLGLVKQPTRKVREDESRGEDHGDADRGGHGETGGDEDDGPTSSGRFKGLRASDGVPVLELLVWAR